VQLSVAGLRPLVYCTDLVPLYGTGTAPLSVVVAIVVVEYSGLMDMHGPVPSAFG